MLAELASELAANPFAKVVDMIKSLITKLTHEAERLAQIKGLNQVGEGASGGSALV